MRKQIDKVVAQVMKEVLDEMAFDYTDRKGKFIGVREPAEKVQGQLLVWKDEDFAKDLTKFLQDSYTKIKPKKDSTAREDLIITKEDAVIIGKKIEAALLREWNNPSLIKKIGQGRWERVSKDYAPYIKSKYPGTRVAPVINFRKAQDIKARLGTVNKIILDYMLKNKGFDKFISGQISQNLGKLFNVGHGQYGGYSVSQMTQAENLRRFEKKISEIEDFGIDGISTEEARKKALSRIKAIHRTYFNDPIRKANKEIIKKEEKAAIRLDHTRLFDSNGNFNENFVIVISMQDAATNNEDSIYEKAAPAAFRRKILEILEAPGSYSFIESVHSIALYNLLKRLPKGSYKLFGKVKPKRVIKRRKTTKVNYKDKRSYEINVGQFNLLGALDPQRFAKVAGKMLVPDQLNNATNFNPIQLQALLDEEINIAVKANMGTPALNNRTGRFAESVSIAGVIPSSGSSPAVINYTYQKNPYQKFESDQMRDPRLLIDKSIREVAARAMQARFITKRV